MDDKIVIKGVPPYDGEYPIDFETLTMGELHTLKRIAGVRAREISEALAAGDTDLLVAFAIIALQRAGKDEVDESAIWNSEAGRIEIRVGQEDDAGPPASTPKPQPQDSGESSEATSDENQATVPSSTGTPT